MKRKKQTKKTDSDIENKLLVTRGEAGRTGETAEGD